MLGFERVGGFEPSGGERWKVFLRHRGLPVWLGLVEHRDSSKRRFDETEGGLDHLAFAVPSRGGLDWRADRFHRRRGGVLLDRGVRHDPRRLGPRLPAGLPTPNGRTAVTDRDTQHEREYPPICVTHTVAHLSAWQSRFSVLA